MNTNRCSQVYATERTRVLLGCYRYGDCEDPEVFVPAVENVFLHYTVEVVRAVTDPMTGLPGQSPRPGERPRLPYVCEIRQACENEAARQYRFSQMAAHRNAPRLSAPLPPSDEARARAVAHWLQIRPMFEPEPKRGSAQPTATTEAELRAFHCGQLKRLAAQSGVTITDADIAAVPDA